MELYYPYYPFLFLSFKNVSQLLFYVHIALPSPKYTCYLKAASLKMTV